jgi:hypothetical protein
VQRALLDRWTALQLSSHQLPSGGAVVRTCRRLAFLLTTCRCPPACLPAHSLQLRKAEAVVDNDAAWQGGPVAAARRQRMRAITYNNLGCLFKRRNLPQLALQYLQKALALEEAGGPVQNSSSTHLNICAAFSALKRPKEVRSGAARQGLQAGNFLAAGCRMLELQ